MISYVSLVTTIILVLGVPLKGSLVALTIGAALFVLASTGLGMLISTLVRSQVAAIFATALICLVPSVNFSGLLYPVSTLVGGSYWVGVGFPSSWFQIVSLGTFTKGLGMDSFAQAYLALGGFGLAFITAARFMLGKQEA
jgi:ribosome-dependent ATPase